MNFSASRPGIWKKLILLGVLGAFAGMIAISIHPVHSTSLRVALLACLVGAWLGPTIHIWKYQRLKILALLLPLLAALPFLLPGREIDPSELRQDYVRRLIALEGTPYFWGGENFRGIDCSGLPRRALRDALLSYGFRHFNGRALRNYLEQWWFDASAKALGEGYRDDTSPLGVTGTIQQMSEAQLLPGDLAVTTNGVHILAYLGDGQWVQADPGLGSVVILDGRKAHNVWFRTPVTMHRWKYFQSAEITGSSDQ